MPLARIRYGNLYADLLTPHHGVAGVVDEEITCDSPGYMWSPKFNERICSEGHVTKAKRAVFGQRFEPPTKCGEKDCRGTGRLELTWDGKRHFLTESNRFPAGLVPRIEALLRRKGYDVEIEGAPDIGMRRSVDPAFVNGDRLRPHQEEACEAALKAPYMRGVIRVPTAGGKTHIQAALARSFGGSVLSLVYGKVLLNQTHDGLETILGEEVGLMGFGKLSIKRVTVASPDTVYRRLDDPRIKEFLRQVELALCDEVHRSSSTTWTKILRAVRTGNRFGLSGTPFKIGEQRDLMLEAWVGPMIYDVSPKRLQEEGFLSRAILTAVRIRRPRGFRSCGWNDAQDRLILNNLERTRAVADIAARRASEGHKVFLFAGNNLAYADRLYKAVCERYRGVALATGQKDLETNARNLRRFKDGIVSVLVATVIYDEGINVPQADVGILANIQKSYRQVMQRIGRILRPKEDGGVAEVIDFIDLTNPHLEDHARKRLEFYAAEGVFDDVKLIEDGVEQEFVHA